MKFEMECLTAFKDGGILKETFSPGDVIVVEGGVKEQLLQSDPHAWDVTGLIRESENKCPECGFVAKSALGLSSHMRHKHGE